MKTEVLELMKREAIMLKQNGTYSYSKRKKLNELTRREMEVLVHWAEGLSRDEIADLLKITVHGVKKHIASIYAKLDAVNRIEAIHIAQANGLLSDYSNPQNDYL